MRRTFLRTLVALIIILVAVALLAHGCHLTAQPRTPDPECVKLPQPVREAVCHGQ